MQDKNSVFSDRLVKFKKGELHLQQNWACFVCYSKIINTVLKNNMSILNQIIWETKKWHNNFIRLCGSWDTGQNSSLYVLIKNRLA